MQGTIHDNFRLVQALDAQNLSVDATKTGEIIDTKGVRELVLVVNIGAVDLGSGAVNLQWFAGDDDDMGDEAQVGSNRVVTAEMVANTQAVYRFQSHAYKRFQRFKWVLSGSTSPDTDFAAVAVLPAGKDRGGATTLVATIDS